MTSRAAETQDATEATPVLLALGLDAVCDRFLDVIAAGQQNVHQVYIGLEEHEIFEVDHLHNDLDVLPGGGAQVVLLVTLALKLQHHVFDGGALAADAAELVPQPVSLALQCIFDEGFTLCFKFPCIVQEGHADFMKAPYLARVVLKALEDSTTNISGVDQALLDLSSVLQRKASLLLDGQFLPLQGALGQVSALCATHKVQVGQQQQRHGS